MAPPIGFKHSKEAKRKIANYRLGKKLSEESKRKVSLGKMGVKRLKPFTAEHRKKISNAIKGEKHYLWKGDNTSYRSLHHWVTRAKGVTKSCSFCGKEKTTPKSIHWANKSHKYFRNLEDWIQLCVKCHKNYDLNYKKSC